MRIKPKGDRVKKLINDQTCKQESLASYSIDNIVRQIIKREITLKFKL